MGLLDLFSEAYREPAECIVTIDGVEASDLYPFLSEISVECTRTEATVAKLKFETRRDENGEWTVQDQGILAPWKSILIEAAFGNSTEEVMRGFIREVSADYPEDASATTVTVDCQDDSIALDREHLREVWGGDAPTDDSTILGSILGNHGLAPHADNASGGSSLTINQDATDFAFLRDRAEANGYEILFRDGEVYFGPMRMTMEPQPPLMVYAGNQTNCYQISVQAKGDQPDSVVYDAASAEGATAVQEVVVPDLELLGTESADSSGAGLSNYRWRMTRQGGADESALALQAQRKANELAMKVVANGELDGSRYGHVLRVAEPVAVDGLGSWLGGIYYVDKVSHRFSTGGYRQSFTLLRNAFGDNLEGSSNLLSGLI